MLSAVIVRARSTAVGASLPSELGLAPNTKKALARCMWVEPVQQDGVGEYQAQYVSDGGDTDGVTCQLSGPDW